jgi:shikimate dehydrogenase
VQPIVALLAYPVAANPMQYVIEKAFARHDLDWRFLTLEVAPDDLGDAVRGMRAMGFRGGMAAEPHKQTILPLLGKTTDSAALIGTVNLILREEHVLVGENTEGKGLVEAVRRWMSPAGRRFFLVGAGQAGRAIAVELAAAGAAEIRVMNRTPEKAAALVSLLTEKFPAVAASAVAWEENVSVPADADVLVNASSIAAGEPEARLPLATESLRRELLVADMAISPPGTRLLRDAAARGCTTVDGLTSLVEQVAVAFRLWIGQDPDRQVMREAIEEFLEL